MNKKYNKGDYILKGMTTSGSLVVEDTVVKEKSSTNKENKTKDVKFDNSDKNTDKQTYEFIGSSEVVDRDGDIVMLDGINYSYFKENPVVLWAHNSRETAIGKVVGVKHDTVDKKAYFDIQFASTEKGKEVEQLVKEGIIRATSIGFMVDEWEYDEEKDVFVLSKTELREISLCNIPANQGAVTDANEIKSTDEQNGQVEKSTTPVLDEASIQEMVSRMVAQAIESQLPKTEEPQGEPEESGNDNLEVETPEEPNEPVEEPETPDTEPNGEDEPKDEPEQENINPQGEIPVELIESFSRQVLEAIRNATTETPKEEEVVTPETTDSVVEPEDNTDHNEESNGDNTEDDMFIVVVEDHQEE